MIHKLNDREKDQTHGKNETILGKKESRRSYIWVVYSWSNRKINTF